MFIKSTFPVFDSASVQIQADQLKTGTQQFAVTTIFAQDQIKTVQAIPGAIAAMLGNGIQSQAGPGVFGSSAASATQPFSFSGYNPYAATMNHFALGGMVYGDQIAGLHDGERVLTADEVRASMSMSTAGSSAGRAASPSASPISGAGPVDSHDTYQFEIQGIQDPEMMARAIAAKMKHRSPKLRAYSN